MENSDKKSEYPKTNENDSRWKHQDEFDSAGALRQMEDEEKNNSISQAADDLINADNQKHQDTYTTQPPEKSRPDREQP